MSFNLNTILLVLVTAVFLFLVVKVLRGGLTMMRFMMGIHLFWQKCEVGLAGLLVPGLVLESSIANGWVYAGGSFHDPTALVIGVARGFFFEVLTYISARQAFLMVRPPQGRSRNIFGCVLMAVLCLCAMSVSAVNNLGWVMAGHDLGGLFSIMGTMLGGGPVFRLYQFFLAVLLPVAVGFIALVPLDHFFQHALEQDHLDNHALQVDERSMHRTSFLKAQRAQRDKIEDAYHDIAEERAELFIEQARTGDLTFGASQRAALPAPGQTTSPRSQTVTGNVWPVQPTGSSSVWSSGPGIP